MNSEAAGYSLFVDTAGNVFSTGYFKGTVDFDPSNRIYSLSGFGDYDIFISKLDTSVERPWILYEAGVAKRKLGKKVKVNKKQMRT